MALFMLPGNLASDLVGLEHDSDHRQILRMFVNTLFWSAAGALAVVLALI